MSIVQLSILLDEIKGYVDDYKLVKEENITLKSQLETAKEVKVEYEERIATLESEKVDLENSVDTLRVELNVANNTISEKETCISKLKDQVNLNLSKAQEIVNELKEIINAK